MQAENFVEFYRAVHGYPPFPWQQRLLSRVLAGDWPDTLALPTASGKTSVIDIAVFSLAAQAHLPLHQRRAPLRLFFVIDRRLVVDEAHHHAEKLARALREADSGIVRQVAERLESFDAPVALKVVALRGGMYREENWAGVPNQPLVAVTTVDQAGSRLLFRGYGLSPRQYPVQAGLLGNDAWFVVDEAHLSEPFVETLQAVARFRQRAALAPPGPFRVTVMSATPRERASAFELDEADRQHPELGRRLRASKPAMLDASPAAGLVKVLVAHARRLAAQPGVTLTGVIVNRVDTARAVFEALHRHADAVLLTGRIRAFDRDRLLADWAGRIMGGRGGKYAPAFLVATQTVEVGANIDLDALVTETAPLAALRQRFGRLNRLGKRDASPAVVVLRQSGRTVDPVYGGLAEQTHQWLLAQAGEGEASTVDFGIQALEARLAHAQPPALPPRTAPVLLPAHLDLLAQTDPLPHPDPQVAVFLRGVGPDLPEVQLIWRADLAEDPQRWADIVAAQPPRAREVLAVPIGAARAWLRGAPVEAVSDLEGGGDADGSAGGDGSRWILRWRGDDSEIIPVDGIRPGDTLIVPASRGGADAFGWHPQGTAPVADIADACAWEASDHGQGPARLRLCPALLPDRGLDDLRAALADLLTALTDPEARDEAELASLHAALRTALEQATDHPLRELLARLLRAGALPQPYPDEGEPVGVVLSAHPAAITDEDDASSLICREVALDNHLEGVASRAAELARRCGLAGERQRDIALAAAYHDLGKAEPRFQVMLYGGDELKAVAGEPLAKSGMDAGNRRAMHRVRERARLPAGFRHELVSVALLDALPAALAGAADAELVRYLVGVHHGRCRPFPPVVEDPVPSSVRVSFRGHDFEAGSNHGLARLEAGWVESFWRLQRRYGYWGLAYLEAVLRLADRARSREESEA